MKGGVQITSQVTSAVFQSRTGWPVCRRGRRSGGGRPAEALRQGDPFLHTRHLFRARWHSLWSYGPPAPQSSILANDGYGSRHPWEPFQCHRLLRPLHLWDFCLDQVGPAPVRVRTGPSGPALIHLVLFRRGLASSYVPPVRVVLSNHRNGYIRGLTGFRGEDVEDWIEPFAKAATNSGPRAASDLQAVAGLQGTWRDQLSGSARPPRKDAAAWAVTDVLPAHPILTAPVAGLAFGRAMSQVYRAIERLEAGTPPMSSHGKTDVRKSPE